MSLVNDMLRDLNRRTPVSSRAARVHGVIQSSIESKKPRIRTGLILAGGLLAGVGAGYFYFQSMGVQLVQVPLAPVPRSAPDTVARVAPPPAPAVDTAATTTPVQTATSDIAAEAPAIETTAEIRELAMQPNGFTLLVETSQAVAFDIRDRSAFGLTLHLEGVDRYDRAGTTVPGMSLLLVSDGLDIGLELGEAADFLVSEDPETEAFDILITASYRPDPASEPPASQRIQETPETPAPSALSSATVEPPPSDPAVERPAPIRVNRELSLEDRDRNNSQEALMMVQGGRMLEAYQLLLTFLDENPSGHQSRETLAKLLLAQQEYAQAGAIVDEGLAQVPNYGAFKKIKARLLMQADASPQALALLRNVPPPIASDTEYHELLAYLYQQSNEHAQAVRSYQELLRIDRQQGRWWMGLGISMEAQDMDAEALASFQAALQAGNLDNSSRQFVQTRISNLGRQP